MYIEIDVSSDLAQGLAHTITGDTAANRIELGGKGENFFAYVISYELLAEDSFCAPYPRRRDLL